MNIVGFARSTHKAKDVTQLNEPCRHPRRVVIPAKAGIHEHGIEGQVEMDSRLRGNDK
jgi:hypothetical protein